MSDDKQPSNPSSGSSPSYIDQATGGLDKKMLDFNLKALAFLALVLFRPAAVATEPFFRKNMGERYFNYTYAVLGGMLWWGVCLCNKMFAGIWDQAAEGKVGTAETISGFFQVAFLILRLPISPPPYKGKRRESAGIPCAVGRVYSGGKAPFGTGSSQCWSWWRCTNCIPSSLPPFSSCRGFSANTWKTNGSKPCTTAIWTSLMPKLNRNICNKPLPKARPRWSRMAFTPRCQDASKGNTGKKWPASWPPHLPRRMSPGGQRSHQPSQKPPKCLTFSVNGPKRRRNGAGRYGTFFWLFTRSLVENGFYTWWSNFAAGSHQALGRPSGQIHPLSSEPDASGCLIPRNQTGKAG